MSPLTPELQRWMALHERIFLNMKPGRIAVMLVVGLCAVSSGLLAQTVVVEFDDGGRQSFSEESQAVIVDVVSAAEIEVRELLPQLTPQITLTVSSGQDVIPETGEAGAALGPGQLRWTVDPSRPEGVIQIASNHLRHTLFHELHHLARGWVISGGQPSTSFMDAVVSEGLATAFARDFSGGVAPWGEYPDDIRGWVDELLALPMSAYMEYGQWMFQHADGRRWIGYRAGTYIVDQAIAASGLSAADLVTTPTEEILELAGMR